MKEGSPPAGNCCNDLFDAFEFTRFQDAKPPKRKGVYVIRIHQRGTPVGEVHEKAVGLAGSIGWDVAGRFLCSRLDRLLAMNLHCQKPNPFRLFNKRIV